MTAVSAWFDLRLRNRGAVAALCVSLAALAFAARTPHARAFVGAVVAMALVVVAATDLERRIIPNRIVLPVSLGVLLAQAAITPGRLPTYLLWAVLAAAFFAVPGLLSPGAVGMGDAKLALLLGAALGRDVIAALLIGMLAMLPVALRMIARDGWGTRKTHLPLGPFLAAGGIVMLVAPLFG